MVGFYIEVVLHGKKLIGKRHSLILSLHQDTTGLSTRLLRLDQILHKLRAESKIAVAVKAGNKK